MVFSLARSGAPRLWRIVSRFWLNLHPRNAEDTSHDIDDTVDDPTNCMGGALAVGGFCASGTYNGGNLSDGTPAQTIAAANIIVNEKYASCWLWNSSNQAETITHEMGHSFGLGHATAGNENATMFWTAHFDGRGASLTDYDVQAVQYLYSNLDGESDPPAADTPDNLVMGYQCVTRLRDGVTRKKVDEDLSAPTQLAVGISNPQAQLQDESASCRLKAEQLLQRNCQGNRGARFVLRQRLKLLNSDHTTATLNPSSEVRTCQ